MMGGGRGGLFEREVLDWEIHQKLEIYIMGLLKHFLSLLFQVYMLLHCKLGDMLSDL